MSKFNFFGLATLTWAMIENERQKKEFYQRQENKNVAQRMRKQSISRCLGQHKYMYLSNRSR